MLITSNWRTIYFLQTNKSESALLAKYAYTYEEFDPIFSLPSMYYTYTVRETIILDYYFVCISL